jgi:hypothetical protein
MMNAMTLFKDNEIMFPSENDYPLAVLMAMEGGAVPRMLTISRKQLECLFKQTKEMLEGGFYGALVLALRDEKLKLDESRVLENCMFNK